MLLALRLLTLSLLAPSHPGLTHPIAAPPPFKIVFTFDSAAWHHEFGPGPVEYTIINDLPLRVRLREVARQEALKYPPSMIAKNLNSVCLLERFTSEGDDFGGTELDTTKQLLIAIWQDESGYEEEWVRETFHHELCHLLYDNASSLFPTKEWLAQNDPAFHYGPGREQGQKSDLAENLNPELNKLGILSEYGSSDMDEDMSTYSEYLMTDQARRFWATAASCPRLRAKAMLLLKFYMRLDSAFVPPDTVPAAVRAELLKSRQPKARRHVAARPHARHAR